MQNSTASKLHITDRNGEVKSQIWPWTTKKKVRRKRNRKKSDKGKGGGGGDADLLGVGEKMTKYQVREEGRRIAMSITIMQHVPQRDDLIFAV